MRYAALMVASLAVVLLSRVDAAPEPPAGVVDFRYAPMDWQTAICLPDDPEKTLVGKDGSLRYPYINKRSNAFTTTITLDPPANCVWQSQQLFSPRVPVITTIKQAGDLLITEEAFTLPPLKPSHYDIWIVRFQNRGSALATIEPAVRIDNAKFVGVNLRDQRHVEIGAQTLLLCPAPFDRAEISERKITLHFPKRTIAPAAESAMAFSVLRGALDGAAELPKDMADAQRLRQSAIDFWQKADLPYGHITVPDAQVQALIDSSIRNIYQAREIKNGLPAFQVGPTCYRGLWALDGSFIMEAVAYLGRTEEARHGIDYLLSFQSPNGAILLIPAHWKETGVTLWAVTRHARLTGDKAWLEAQWPRVERAWEFIQKLRRDASADPKSPCAGLIPLGFSDGGLSGPHAEYTNVYWSMAGMRAAIDAARWLGKTQLAEQWQKQYDDFLAAFRKAAERDMRDDGHGHRYLPIAMNPGPNVIPQKAQWAFLHAIFPGQVFANDDPVVRGNMAMLEANENEGLVFDTGWAPQGLWNYFGSFYAHAWLWLGRPDKAHQTLYAFANHASPLLVWREEQMPHGKGDKIIGDMPHNWASAEFIRLVRHLLLLERQDELHLLEGLPPQWLTPNAVTRLDGIQTAFGPVNLEVKVSADGSSAAIHFQGAARTSPAKVVLHLDGWSAQSGTIDLPGGEWTRDVALKK